MTIKDYLKGLSESGTGADFKETMINSVELWSNSACYGYCIEAMRKAGSDREEIKKVISKMRIAFDEVQIEDAEKIYLNF